jgi:hypothetical protein
MNLFQKAKALFAATVATLMTRGIDTGRLLAGRGLSWHSKRRLSPQEWLFCWMRDHNRKFALGFERATKRDERAGYRRRAKTTKTVRGINYRKAANKMRRFNGEPAKLFRREFRMEFGLLIRDPNAVARVHVA